jgi:hypothetical protein
MIVVNAESIAVFVIVLIGVGCGGFWLRGLLMASKDKGEDKDDFNTLICPVRCKNRQTISELLHNRLLQIGYKEYMERCDKEKDMRVEDNLRERPCKTCIEFPCMELDIKDDDELLKSFSVEKLQEILEKGLEIANKCVKDSAKDSEIPTQAMLFGKSVVKFKDDNNPPAAFNGDGDPVDDNEPDKPDNHFKGWA